MAEATGITSINQYIRDKSPLAVTLLSDLPSPCVLDDDGQSPLNVAIEADNTSVIALLIENDEALEFAPDIHSRDEIRHIRTVYNYQGDNDLAVAEKSVLNGVSTPPYWQRTPLLQACRYQNRDAIRELIVRGAKLDAKDLVGETPLSLCIRVGGTELTTHFINTCVSADKRFPVDAATLQELCGSPESYALAIENGRLNIGAKRFVFNLACATLDRPTIEEMLTNGFNPNSAITAGANPVTDVLTSQTAWTHMAAGWEKFAAGYAHANGHPTTVSISIPNNPGPGDLTYGQTVALHRKLNESLRRPEINPKFMSAEERQERLALLQLLLERGLDVTKLEKKLSFPLIAEVVTSNEPEFMVALTKAGLSLAPEDGYMETGSAIRYGCFDMVAPLEKCGHRLQKDEHMPPEVLEEFEQWKQSGNASSISNFEIPKRSKRKKKAVVTWELDGESGLSAEVEPDPPRAGQPFTVRIKHDNVYGPRQDMRFEWSVGDASEAEWRAFELVGETVYVDEQEVDLSSLDEEPFGETPWLATFEATVTLPQGKHPFAIRTTAPESSGCGILSDWVITVVA